MNLKIKKLNNKGFSNFELIFIVVVITVISSVGFYVYSAKKNKSKADSYTTITNKLVHGSYVGIESCWDSSGVTSSNYSNGYGYLSNNLRLTDAKYYNQDSSSPVSGSVSNTGKYSGFYDPSDYKVIILAVQSQKKASTNEWQARGSDYIRYANLTINRIKLPATSDGAYTTVRYYILFKGELQYVRDIKLNEISNCVTSASVEPVSGPVVKETDSTPKYPKKYQTMTRAIHKSDDKAIMNYDVWWTDSSKTELRAQMRINKRTANDIVPSGFYSKIYSGANKTGQIASFTILAPSSEPATPEAAAKTKSADAAAGRYWGEVAIPSSAISKDRILYFYTNYDPTGNKTGSDSKSNYEELQAINVDGIPFMKPLPNGRIEVQKLLN